MLLRQTLIYLPAQLLPPLAQFAFVLHLTHRLPPADYGLLLTIIAAQELIFAATLHWWTHQVLRVGGAAETDQRTFGALNNGLVLAAALATLPATLLLLAGLGAGGDPALVAAAWAYAATRNAVAVATEHARQSAALAAHAGLVLGSVLVGIALALLGMGLFGNALPVALAGLAAGQVLACLACLRLLWMPGGIAFPRRELAAALRYGGPLALSGIIAWWAGQGIRFIVQALEGADALGQLAVGWGLGQRIMAVAAMVVTAAAYPLAVARLHSEGDRAAVEQLSRSALLLLAVMLPAMAGAIMLSTPLIRLFVAPVFQQTTLVVLPLAILVAGLRNLRVHGADPLALLRRRSRLALGFNSLEAVLVLAAVGAGALAGGLVGAVAGALAGTVVAVLPVMAWAWHHGLRPPPHQVGAIVLATAVMVVALLAMGTPTSVTGLLLQVVVGGGVYGACLALLLRQTLRETLARLRRREG